MSDSRSSEHSVHDEHTDSHDDGENEKPRQSDARQGDSLLCVHVGNLDHSTTEDMLKDAFKKYNYTSVKVIKYRNGDCKGFGFVYFDKDKDLQDAVAEMNGATIGDHKIDVEPAKHGPRPSHIHERPYYDRYYHHRHSYRRYNDDYDHYRHGYDRRRPYRRDYSDYEYERRPYYRRRRDY